MKNFKKKVRRILIATSLASVLSTGPLDLHNPDNTAPITVSAQAQRSVSATQFIQSINQLPKVSEIENMTQSQLIQVKANAQNARSLYYQLSYSSRRNSTVSRWEGFLAEKETAVQKAFSNQGVKFIQQVRNLPYVSAIQEMSYNQLTDLQEMMRSIRRNFNSLSTDIQHDETVARWEGFLADKETIAFDLYSEEGAAFVQQVLNLPSVSSIQTLTVGEKRGLQETMAAIRAVYENLSPSTKRHVDVVKWEKFLTLKEDATDEVDQEHPHEDEFNQFDLQLFNEEFLALVNAERNRLGVHSLYYDEHLQRGADIRSEELIEIGGLRVNNVPHVRPDGSSWIGAFDYYRDATSISYASGENIAMISYTLSGSGSFSEYLTEGNHTLEQALASIFYEIYSNSPGHYENMISSHHTGFSVSIGFDLAFENYYKQLNIYNPMIFSAEYPY